MFPASRIFAPFAPIPPGDNPHTLQAPSPGPDQWRLRLRTTADPASPSHPSPGPSWPGGAVAGPPVPATLLHVRTAPTPVGKVTTRLNFRTAPTPVGKVITLLHVRTAPNPVGKVTPRIPHTPGRKPGSVFSQPSLGHLSGCGRAARQQ